MRSLPRDAVLALLALGAALWLPVVLAASGWLPSEPARLYGIAATAWTIGIVLAAVNSSDNTSRLVAVLLGLLAGAHFSARILPPLAMIAGDVVRVASWLWYRIVGGPPDLELPLSYGLGHLYWQTRGLLEQLGLWAYNVRQGMPNTDNTALLFATAVGTWLLAYNATHELVARQRAFAGLLPVAVAVGVNVYLGRMSDTYVYAYLGVLVVALVWANVSHMERHWARSGLAPRRTFRLASLGVGTLLGALAMAAALAAPNATYAWTFHTFWREHGARIETFYRRLDDAFAGRNPITRRAEAQAAVVTVNVIEVPVTPTPALESVSGHTIGAGIDPGDVPVMWVTLDAPPEGQVGTQGLAAKYYWRERTYDTYTGRGWENGPTEAMPLTAHTPWTTVEGPRRILAQTYTMLRPTAYAYGANEPVSLSLDAALVSRGPGDLVALAATADSYTVWSHVPAVAIADLRTAEGEYPAWVRERHLALPPIRERIRAEAYRVVSEAGATTRYDRARAIEGYLRRMTYDLEVPAPPAGADVVDHFVFETRTGFCDYSASAMTVMLRALGIAARYASGYGMGEYRPEQNAWLVTTANSHAWVEVYFPGLGWIEFEPTPGQGTFQRPEARPTPDPAIAPLDAPTPAIEEPGAPPGGVDTDASLAELRRLGRRYSWLALLIGAALLWVVVAQRPCWLPTNGQSPRATVLGVYRRLIILGRVLGSDPTGATPREALTALERELWRRFGPRMAVSELAVVYERARYGAAPVTWGDAEAAQALWHGVRAAVLRRAWRLMARRRQGVP